MLTSAPRRVRVEAMMIFTAGSMATSFGMAVRPSITGISISSTMTSMLWRVSALIAIWPSPTDATTRNSRVALQRAGKQPTDDGTVVDHHHPMGVVHTRCLGSGLARNFDHAPPGLRSSQSGRIWSG